MRTDQQSQIDLKLPSGWNCLPLGELAESQYGISVAVEEGGTVPILGMRNLQDGVISFENVSRVTLSEGEITQFRLQEGDILFNRTNSIDLVGKTALVVASPEEPTVFASYLIRFCVNSDIVTPYFVNYVMNSEGAQRLFRDMATPGVGQYNINPTVLKRHFRVLLPPLAEQRAISAVLTAWDRGIRQSTDLIAAKRRLKHGLMQQLLSGKLQFNGEEPDFQRVAVGEVVKKVSTAVEVDAGARYREIGIRSHGKGIFHKEPVFGAVLGNKRVYMVEPGCLTVNIVFAWEQAVAVTTASEAGFIASHRFPMFKPDLSRAEAMYLLHYFLSPKGSEALQLASPGGAGRNRTMSQSAFLKLMLPLPSIRFQQRFVSLVENLDSEVSLLTQQLAFLKTQKKGLMRKLLTGEVRVKVPS